MEKAKFTLVTYSFPKAAIDFTPKDMSELTINFDTKGQFTEDSKEYSLDFDVQIETTSDEIVAAIKCNAIFKFKEVEHLEDIPDFFYPNSLAIIFPYIRAFISTMSLQSNIKPIVLPTINLNGLTEELKSNTRSK